MKVLVIDYGMGNLGSVSRSLEECGADVIISSDPGQLREMDKIVLPGVGAFHDGMKSLVEQGLDQAITDFVKSRQGDLLGICLGMQLLADLGFEGKSTKGLGLIPGQVVRLEPTAGERIPHVGWNELHQSRDSGLWRNIPNSADFYFVHSYHFVAADEQYVIGTTPYCGSLVSAINREHIYGVQFHPEKSSHLGHKVLANFLAL